MISAAIHEIEGHWTITGDWSGAVLMVRARGEAAAKEAAVADEMA